MKKVLAGMMVLGMMLGAGAWSAGEAQAACGLAWIVNDGESVSYCGGQSEGGNFLVELEPMPDESGYISKIVLTDYKGEIKLEAYGGRIPVKKYMIELNGDNELIIAEKEDMLFGGVSYELAGEGRLLVRTGDATKECTSGEASGGVGGSHGEDLPDDALIGPTEEQATGSSAKIGWMIGGIAAGVYIVGSLIAFVVIGVKSNKRKAAEKVTEVGAANGGAVADSASEEEPGDNLGSEE